MASPPRLLSLLCALPFLFLSPSQAYTNLTTSSLRSIPRPGSTFDINDGSILSPILVPRVAGTEENLKVLGFFTSWFAAELPNWTITTQNSTSKTPVHGDNEVPFRNLIATRDPPWAGPGEVSYLTLAAHYDSKLTPKGFIGAVDSAAPCAMVMHAALAAEAALLKKWEQIQAQGGEDTLEDTDNKGVMLILFDGEEAFLSWADDDSIYGARSLAAAWEQTPHAALSTFRNPLDSIELFVLLDLLGAKDPKLPSYYPTTHWAYRRLAALEARMRGLGLFRSDPKGEEEGGEAKWFYEAEKDDGGRWFGGVIGDDHVPFLQRGVEVLHWIPSPFPQVWHTMDDNAENLDMDTVGDWAVLTTAFLAEWMDLEGFMEGEGTGADEKHAPRDELGS